MISAVSETANLRRDVIHAQLAMICLLLDLDSQKMSYCTAIPFNSGGKPVKPLCQGGAKDNDNCTNLVLRITSRTAKFQVSVATLLQLFFALLQMRVNVDCSLHVRDDTSSERECLITTYSS